MTERGLDIKKEYFEWLYNLVYRRTRKRHSSYKELLWFLHNTEFIFTIQRDSNRAADGVDLRYRFARELGYDVSKCLSGPCNVLEMLVALAIQCEDHIMYDPDAGDRTGKWFWDMIANLGLGLMSDDRFDERFVDEKVSIFLNREYEPDGKGGLFTVKNCRYDMRTVEIWYQMNWYLSSKYFNKME